MYFPYINIYLSGWTWTWTWIYNLRYIGRLA